MTTKRRRFYDVFCGLIKNADLEELEAWYLKAVGVGYHGCVLCFELNRVERNNELVVTLNDLRKNIDLLNEKGLHIYLRCHLKAETPGKVKRLLSFIRGWCDLISLEASSREILAFASRDRRIDIVTLVPGESPKFFRGDLLYLKEYGKFVEVPFSLLVEDNPIRFSKNISHARFLLEKPSVKNIPILISSGTVGSLDPRSLLSFSELVLGLDYSMLSRAMSIFIEKKIIENKEKRLGIRPVEGVRVEDAM